MNKTKALCLLFILVFPASCAPVLAPQSSMSPGTIDITVTPSPLPIVTATHTATFTPTSFPPGFAPSPVPTPTFPEGSCQQGPVEELEFDLPAPSDLRWETVDNFQRLTGLTGPVHFAHPSPDGRWWVIELVTRRDSSQYELALEEALYVLDTIDHKHWVASVSGKDNFHRFDWLPNSDLIWIDNGELYIANAEGQERHAIQVPEPVIEVWLDKVTGRRALVSGQTALWRLDLSMSSWERVIGLEGLVTEGEPPISRLQANLRMSNDGTFGALLADHQVWKVPMMLGEPARKVGEVDYSDEWWRPEAPQPLADSLYWYPGRDVYDPQEANSQYSSPVLIHEEDGSFLSLEDIVRSYSDPGFYLTLTVSPDARWISILNLNGSTIEGLYLVPTNQLTKGRVLQDAYVFDWDPPGLRATLPRSSNHPAVAFVVRGQIQFGNATLNQIDLRTGKTIMVKTFGAESLSTIIKMTWVNNTPIFTEGEIMERIAENGTLQPFGKIPELHSYEYPKLLLGGTKDQLLFVTTVDKSVDHVCRTQYSLYIAKLDFAK
jgi:hypothetical protein